MDIYTCKVNLNSKSDTQVALSDVTAAEILILRAIHNDPAKDDTGGMDPVVDIKKTADVERSDEEEKDRLTGAGPDSLGIPKYRMDHFRKVFPNDYIPMPQKLKEFEEKPKAKAKAKADDDLAAMLE